MKMGQLSSDGLEIRILSYATYSLFAPSDPLFNLVFFLGG